MGRKREFDYYIYIDYSENLIGYMIIKKDKIKELLPKISRFRHYRRTKNRKLYLKNVNNTFRREKLLEYFLKLKIRNREFNIEIYSDVFEFLKKYLNCIIFISVDDREYRNFIKLVNIVDSGKTKIVKESQLRKGTLEYQVSLVLDNLLNIKRRQQK